MEDKTTASAIIQELSEHAVIRLSPEPDDPLPKLRSRVEQQSTLIAMLKQRIDETLKELEQCKWSYEETLGRKQELEQKLAEEVRRRGLVETRFNDLAKNHEEMIKIKDEYKISNNSLRTENERLRRENEMKFSAAVQDREKRVAQLQEDLDAKSVREKGLEGQCSQLQVRVRELDCRLEAEQERLKLEVERWERELTASQQVQQQLRNTLVSREDEVKKLTQEKVEAERLHRDKEKSLQSKESQLEELQSELLQAELESQRLKENFRVRAEEVSKDAQVSKLRRELCTAQERVQTLEREFSAYKKHSSELLKQERELNSKLRNLVE